MYDARIFTYWQRTKSVMASLKKKLYNNNGKKQKLLTVIDLQVTELWLCKYSLQEPFTVYCWITHHFNSQSVPCFSIRQINFVGGNIAFLRDNVTKLSLRAIWEKKETYANFTPFLYRNAVLKNEEENTSYFYNKKTVRLLATIQLFEINAE